MIFLGYKNMPSFKKEEKKVCVKLSCVVEKKPVIQKKQVIQKKHISKKKAVVKSKPKPKPKLKPKHILKKKPKPKPKQKKVEVIKKEEIVKVKPETIAKKEVITEKEIVPEEEIEEIKTFTQTTTKEQLLQEYYQDNIAKIAQLLQDNLYYPRSARKRGIVGEVMVKFRLSTDAEVYDIEVISSKNKILSRSAIKTIKNLSGKFPKPKEELILKVPIDYRLKR